MSRRTKAQQSILDERLDEIVAEIVSKKSQSSNLTTNNISKAEEETSSRIKTIEVIDWTPQKPSCPKHKSEMSFDKSESKWKCTDEECKVVARRRENSKEPNPANLPSGEVLLYRDKSHNRYYIRQSDRLIALPAGTAYQNYLPYEVPVVQDAIGFVQIPIKYTPIPIDS
jgi:hypothetical protein